MANALNGNLEERKKRLLYLLEPVAVTYLYILSVVAPHIGLVLGIVLTKKSFLEVDRRLEKNCTIISAIMLGVLLVCFGIYFITYAFIGPMTLGYGASRGLY